MRHAVTAIATILLLAGCGSSASTPAASTSRNTESTAVAGGGATPAASAPSAHLVGRPDAAHLAAGVKAMRKTYPALMAGRKDRSISNDIDGTCFDAAQTQDRGVVLQHVAARFARPGKPLNDKAAAALLKVVQAAACTA